MLAIRAASRLKRGDFFEKYANVLNLDKEPPVGAKIPQIQKMVANHDPMYSSICKSSSDSSCGRALVG